MESKPTSGKGASVNETTPLTEGRRPAIEIATEFVLNQSGGEWDEKTVNADAAALVLMVIEPERAHARRLERALAGAEEALRGFVEMFGPIERKGTAGAVWLDDVRAALAQIEELRK